METTKAKFTCKICEQFILEDAVYLPCHETVCRSHLNRLTNNSNDEAFKCPFCKNTHTKRECLKDNDIVNAIVKNDEHLLELEKEHKKYSFINNEELNSLCHEYKEKGDELKKSNEEHFKRVINEIDTKKVELMLIIENLANDLKEKANKAKEENESRLSRLIDNSLVQDIDPSSDKAKIQTEIRRSRWDYDALDNINREAVENINKINEKLSQFKSAKDKIEKCLFDQRESNNLKENLLGKLQLEVIDATTSPNFVKLDFKSYKELSVLSSSNSARASSSSAQTPSEIIINSEPVDIAAAAPEIEPHNQISNSNNASARQMTTQTVMMNASNNQVGNVRTDSASASNIQPVNGNSSNSQTQSEITNKQNDKKSNKPKKINQIN